MTVKITIVLVVLMSTMVFAVGVQAQTDLYEGKKEIQYAGKHFYVACYSHGNVEPIYFIGNKTNTKIRKGAYRCKDGSWHSRDGLMENPATLCSNYYVKLRKIANAVFTKREINRFIEKGCVLDVWPVIDFNKRISDIEFCFDDIAFASIPFSKYYRLGELIRANLKFSIPEGDEETLKNMNGGFYIVTMSINFGRLYNYVYPV
jgi:hypothetical protein